MNEVAWLEERLRDIQIVEVVRVVNAWVSGAFDNAYAVDRWQNMSMVLIAFKYSKPGSLVFFSSKQYSL